MSAASAQEAMETDPDRYSQDQDVVSNNGEDYSDDTQSDCDSLIDEDEIKSHASYEQVMLDVNRCAGRLQHMRQVYLHRTDDDYEPPEDLTDEIELQRLADISDEPIDELESAHNMQSDIDATNDVGDEKEGHSQRDTRVARDLQNQRKLKGKLAELIVRLLIKNPDLHYYQGFHDVCLTYMTLYGYEEAHKKLTQLVVTHFGTFMRPTMDETQEFLALVPMIVGLYDSKVQNFLEAAEVGTIFSLSWVITWFSHVIPNPRDVEKIFDFLEGQDPHMVLYLSAAIVISKQKELLELEPEMSTVHHFLCQVPRKEKLPIERLLVEASAAYMRWSPESVKQKLDLHRRSKLQLHNTNIITGIASGLGPIVANVLSNHTRTALVVFVLASAFALQWDKWIR